MEKRELSDEELIEAFACKHVKAALPKNKENEKEQSHLKWKELWKRITGKFK